MDRIKYAWISGVALLLAAAGAGSGCTTTVTSGDGGDDSGFGGESSTTPDTGTQSETGMPPDSGTTPDVSATPDTATTPDTGATADSSDGGSCAVLKSVTFGSMPCDQCLSDHCCNETTACFTGAENDCADAVSCYLDCLVGKPDAGIDAGDPTSCKAACSGFDAMATMLDAWLTCETNNCASLCQ
jgi:hypothetical protein